MLSRENSDYVFIEDAKTEANLSLLLGVTIGSFASVENAIKRGANINVQDENGETALDIATKKTFAKTIEVLMKYNARRSPSFVKLGQVTTDANISLLLAATVGNIADAEDALIRGANVNVLDERCETALDLATRKGFNKTSAMLKTHGALSGKIFLTKNKLNVQPLDTTYKKVLVKLEDKKIKQPEPKKSAARKQVEQLISETISKKHADEISNRKKQLLTPILEAAAIAKNIQSKEEREFDFLPEGKKIPCLPNRSRTFIGSFGSNVPVPMATNPIAEDLDKDWEMLSLNV